MTHREAEFAILRYTIAARGTARAVLVAATLMGWAIVASLHVLFSDLPLTTVIPLVLLAGGYEVVWGTHIGIERVGRYLQVRYEQPDGALWETTAMAAAPGLPGFGANPLVSWVFAAAALVNLGGAFVEEPTPVEVLLLVACHGVVIARVGYTRVRASAQRASDLATFTRAAGSGESSVAPRETSSDNKNS
jgi:hypothetical protein